MNLIIVFLSICFDLLLLNIFKFTSSSISFFYPMFTITSIVFICNFYKHANRKNYYYFVLLTAIIYDTFFVNNLLITISLFLLVAFINMKLKQNFSNNLIFNIIRAILSIFIYDFLFHFLLVAVKYQSFNLNRVIYKVTHSIFLNLIYIIVMFLVLKPKKA